MFFITERLCIMFVLSHKDSRARMGTGITCCIGVVVVYVIQSVQGDSVFHGAHCSSKSHMVYTQSCPQRLCVLPDMTPITSRDCTCSILSMLYGC